MKFQEFDIDIKKIHLNGFTINNSALEVQDFHFQMHYFQELIPENRQLSHFINVEVYADERFEQKLATIETRSDYEIRNMYLILEEKTIPDKLELFLLDLAIDSTRGFLVAKSAGTLLENSIIPLFDAQALIDYLCANHDLTFLLNEARVYASLGNLLEANRILELVSIHHPSIEVLIQIAKIYISLEHYDRALETAQKILKTQGTDAEAHGVVAEVYAYQEEHDLFYEHLRTALQYGFSIQKLNKTLYEKYKEAPQFQTFFRNYQLA